MDKVLYKKVCLGIVLLLLSGEFTAQSYYKKEKCGKI